eukprot:3193725-Prymnesium_polylepis.3
MRADESGTRRSNAGPTGSPDPPLATHCSPPHPTERVVRTVRRGLVPRVQSAGHRAYGAVPQYGVASAQAARVCTHVGESGPGAVWVRERDGRTGRGADGVAVAARRAAREARGLRAVRGHPEVFPRHRPHQSHVRGDVSRRTLPRSKTARSVAKPHA